MSALARFSGLSQVLVHTGQHYDDSMSRVFFEDLGLREPDINLGVGSGSHATQTGQIMLRLEGLLSEFCPELVLVYGDVNSTLAAALVCAKMVVPLGHVEAGLRSFDRTMPEEVNRAVADRLADLLFTPSADADSNLVREGVSPSRIHLVGNVMIDSLVEFLPKARKPVIDGLSRAYALVTLHRPSSVDDPVVLTSLMTALRRIGRSLQVLFPVHPRTRARLDDLGLLGGDGGLRLLDPLGYLEFLGLEREAALVVTDSGGVQEETTYLGIPCLTVGTNTLVGHDVERLLAETDRILAGAGKQGRIPPLWDGKAGLRIAENIAQSNREAGRAGRQSARLVKPGRGLE
jgi:UDP-N-acetylglucosamine 2-epimerase (non-hydrolysing)